MKTPKQLAELRREYGELGLSEDSILLDPIELFKHWLDQVLQTEVSDPTAMVLSTVDAQGHPDSRVVLLKGLEDGCFIFYTNYLSMKAKQLDDNPHGALNFFWPSLSRQVRIRGRIIKIKPEESDQYFYSRPLTSQLSAIISPQSQEIANRAVLDDALRNLIAKQGDQPVQRPSHWGGYKLCPDEIEFWQGRNNRLHDRMQYVRTDTKWCLRRLAP